jgi:cobalt-zinc-cadmium resistance protein CzcA
MIQKLVDFALRMPFIILATATCLVIAGLTAYSRLDIEAYPNPVPPLVEVITQPDGWSAEEVERYVTVPLEIGLAGMQGLEHTRSQSLFGLSDVKCYFDWSSTYEKARQEVINRLGFVQLPPNMQASISPWNAIGEVFRYSVEGRGYTTRDLKTAEDWILERQFKQVKGVIDVVSFGGETKQYHVEVDPYRLRGQNTQLSALITGIQAANTNVGGQRLVMGEQAYTVRGIGLLRDVHDIENVVISETKGVPTRVRDIANVSVGYAPRLGIVGHDDVADIVQGVILMRYGGETQPTLVGIHERIDYIRTNHILPPGMDIVPYYDRGNLVKLTTHTVLENLVVGMLLVSIVLFLFLGHTRAAIITALNIPLALLVAFCGLVGTNTSANLISLGAVDFGIVVDSTVIMMENIFRHLGPHGKGTMPERILQASREVAGPMTFSTLIIGVAFLPLFTMTGVAGVIFSPMAMTYAFAIGGAIVLALTLTPVLAGKFVPAQAEEKEPIVMRALHRVYSPLFGLALRAPKRTLLVALTPVLVGMLAFRFLGGEFMPHLEEGNFWIRATFPMSISLEQSEKYVGQIRSILRGCPQQPGAVCDEAHRRHKEVLTVVSQLGRPDDGTDVAGFQNIELFAPLAPFDEWPRGVTKDTLTDELAKELNDTFPGVVFNFSQVISDNVEEAVSGVKGENSVKVFGNDLEANEKNAQQIVDVMTGIPGIKDLGMFSSMGQPNVVITPDRVACARYGLNTGDVEAVVQAAMGGLAVTQVFEGEKRFDLTIRWLSEYRTSLESIRELAISTPAGGNVPLGQIAKISVSEGPSNIYREDGQRYTPVKFSVRGRDLESTIAEARTKIAAAVHLPYDSHLDWAGEINQLKEAEDRLKVILPVTLLLIAFLVYSAVKNWIDSLIVFVNIPVATAGGVLALLITGIHFSVSAAMGFISIFGIAVQDAILVVTYFQRLRNVEGLPIREAAREASEKRLRPCLMTTLVAMIGLFPAALSTGIGSQTQKPLAVVVIGGAFLVAVVARAVQPPLLLLAHSWMERRNARRGGPPSMRPGPAVDEELNA